MTAGEADRPRLMIVGDSISSMPRYNLTGSGAPVRAWWSYVADALGATATVSAQAGSGMIVKGLRTKEIGDVDGGLDTINSRCNGTTFGERLPQIVEARPDILLVAGGRNDFKTCVDGRIERSTTDQISTGVSAYMRALHRTISSIGMSPRNVYVTTPWGSSYGPQRATVAPLIEKYARREGFSWIMLPALVPGYTVDRTHPTASGARRLSQLVLAGSTLGTRAGVATSGRGAALVCSGFTRCLARHHGSSSDRRVLTHSYWGQPRGADARNYIAYRLTHRGRVVARPPGTTTPDSWKNAMAAAGGALSATPHRGDVAWWQSGSIASHGHLAYVEKVSRDGTAVTVSEISASGSYRWTTYSGRSFPRAFLSFRRSSGTPTGALTSVTSPAASSVKVAGWATDPDAYTAGARIVVQVTQGTRTTSFTVPGHPRYAFRAVLTSRLLRPGAARVRVYAYNAARSKGRHVVLLGTRTLRLGPAPVATTPAPAPAPTSPAPTTPAPVASDPVNPVP